MKQTVGDNDFRPDLGGVAHWAHVGGFEIEFTRAVDEEALRDERSYEIVSWTYEPTAEYGGVKVDERLFGQPQP